MTFKQSIRFYPFKSAKTSSTRLLSFCFVYTLKDSSHVWYRLPSGPIAWFLPLINKIMNRLQIPTFLTGHWNCKGWLIGYIKKHAFLEPRKNGNREWESYIPLDYIGRHGYFSKSRKGKNELINVQSLLSNTGIIVLIVADIELASRGGNNHIVCFHFRPFFLPLWSSTK